MATFRTATIAAVLEARPDLVTVEALLDDGVVVRAVGWPSMLGAVAVDDRIVVNTTGLELHLGTGGAAFILWNLDGSGAVEASEGHIVKLRYTPWQTEVLAAESPESPHHELLSHATSLSGTPVVSCGLHSQIAGIAAGIRVAAPAARIGYLMTDSAALPLAWSDLVRALKEADLIQATATSGHAFGGDLETVNAFTGLLALKLVEGCDVIIAGPGPGVVGTDTTFGFSAIEQGALLDATSALEGTPVACLRISFADARARHRGVSHHAITTLQRATSSRATVVVPLLDDGTDALLAQLQEAALEKRHDIVMERGTEGVDLLTRMGPRPRSMGRAFEDVPELHLAAAAAGAVAARLGSLTT
ncbi:MAG TPA: DUF3866 family protein [Actinomycetota bacterium]|nr:DUF3866 family protein [Actinomycetota bacterium]